ncbi:MAG: hypothetical protein SAK29_22770 [Scytonema sp. PMC 1069.18]|nr:hypothetical protein [Scytonema sp. PMC 1069.18]MEC4885335.1 hypothetical protein [Scytonema sp. PMC 1070.18]
MVNFPILDDVLTNIQAYRRERDAEIAEYIILHPTPYTLLSE